ncbi:hypothetical protein GQ44DRAFT_728927 [Phaeosphaeriaceae sp. PMI808]|nr:hypothetical protein GQ44DRAFT_728927 [Phaeosphaeriaceae sp. PMI808]
MKRSLSDTQFCSPIKRHQSAKLGAPPVWAELTEDALRILQQSLSLTETDDTLARMSAPLPSRSAHFNNRGRRVQKRESRSRTASPSKPSPQTYRIRNLNRVQVYVGSLAGLPPGLEEEVRHILRVESSEDTVTPPADHAYLNDIAA